ncbi:MAG TPA: hypothetical protein VGA66_10340 [Mycobacterium sp.]
MNEQSVYDTFTDTGGNCYVAGARVPRHVYDRVMELNEEIDHLRETLESIKKEEP